MEKDIENYKNDIEKINQRIKGYLWRAKNSIKNKFFKQQNWKPKFLEK